MYLYNISEMVTSVNVGVVRRVSPIPEQKELVTVKTTQEQIKVSFIICHI